MYRKQEVKCSNGSTFAAENLPLSPTSHFYPSGFNRLVSNRRNLSSFSSSLLCSHMCLPFLNFWFW